MKNFIHCKNVDTDKLFDVNESELLVKAVGNWR